MFYLLTHKAMKTNATINELKQAIELTNQKHGYRLSFERIEQKTKNRVIFTLKTPSKVKGARVSHSGRNLPKASWHAHGHFFDTLFSVNPDAFIDSLGHRITKDAGNWQDRNVGSYAFPKMFSECSIGE